MIIRFKRPKGIEYGEADRLLERYYDGLTTVAEEQQLHSFLQQPDLPERFHAEQALFGYHAGCKAKPRPGIRLSRSLRWTSGVAAVALLTIGLHFWFGSSVANYAYIDGQKITDSKQVKSAAMASLNDFSNDDVDTQLGEVSQQQLMEQQLGVFAESEN